eukprot:Em0003g398a
MGKSVKVVQHFENSRSILFFCIAVICNGLPCPSTYVICPETPVEVMCNTTGSSTGPYIYWTLPPGSCPQMNDTLPVIVGRNQNCQDDMHSPCGPFIQRTVPNWSQYPDPYTCSSILTVPRNTSAIIQCKGDDLKNITIIRNSLTPGTLSGVLLNTTGESSLVLTWAPPTTGGAPVNFILTINDSRSPVVIPDNGSPVYNYTFTGLTSNTMYSVSVMASNDGGNGNQTVVNNCTCASPPQNLGVRRYKVYEGSSKTLGFPSANGVLCTTGTCAFLINLDTDPSGKHFPVCVSSLNVVGQNGTANCIYISVCAVSSAGANSIRKLTERLARLESACMETLLEDTLGHKADFLGSTAASPREVGLVTVEKRLVPPTK